MCGIAGFAGSDRGRIERMTAALRHRGPDGTAILLTHGASLGHARLAILDPRPEGDQPMWNDAKTAVIVYNGEIWNYRELRDRYSLDCRTGTDTEVLLKLYDRLGIGFVELLRGMFAFGLYDTSSRTWHLVRDESGIKPLFLSESDGQLHFASEMRSLMTALPQKPPLNTHSLSQYLRLQYVPGPQTMCEGVASLPPGTMLTWSEHSKQRRTFTAKVPSIRYVSTSAFSTSFPSLMDRVVHDSLVSDKPVGIFLSGGMDSSIILHHMCNHAQKPVKTFTVRFEALKEEDARRFNMDADIARDTAAHYGTEHHEIVLTAEECRDVYRAAARSLDQPNADSVAMAQFVLAREAKKHVDVVLCGAGGDELFGGYPRYRVARVLRALCAVPPALRAAAGVFLGYPADVLTMQPGAQLAERLLARPAQEVRSVIRGNWFEPDIITTLFAKRFKELSAHDPLCAFMEFDRGLWLVDESLRLSDAVTMASGLECRPPFLDPLIIAAAHGTQSHWHVGLCTTKKLLKQTYYPLLPSSVRRIPKSSFYPPLAKWLRRECAPLVEETLGHPRIRELFNVANVRRVFDDHLQRRSYGLHTLSSLVQLRCWFEEVYDA